MTYAATMKSLSSHGTPQWFLDAKLGIFIHWGLYSVPAFAPTEYGDISEMVAKHGFEFHLANNPYAEWYQNSLRVNGTAYRTYHEDRFGAYFRYEHFAPMFNDAIKAWSPREWAQLFKDAGARYVVITTKHHDGFTLWPSRHPNPRIPGYHASRNIVGELTTAVRAAGLKMGVYYSGALDWSFSTEPIRDVTTMLSNPDPGDEYARYCDAHVMELVDEFKPSVLWNDIAYPARGRLLEVIARYLNAVPEGAINDRWRQIPGIARHLHKSRVMKALANKIARRIAAKGFSGGQPPKGFANFTTPEYEPRTCLRAFKWEACRGIGRSFGYNQFETADHYLTLEQLVHSFIDVVSKNGNLLLNVGPRADGSISELQVARLRGLGGWLQRNGGGIFGSRPWFKAESTTRDHVQVRFTRCTVHDRDVVNVFVLGVPKAAHVVIKDFNCPPGSEVTILGLGEPVPWDNKGRDVQLGVPDLDTGSIAVCFQVMKK